MNTPSRCNERRAEQEPSSWERPSQLVREQQDALESELLLLLLLIIIMAEALKLAVIVVVDG